MVKLNDNVLQNAFLKQYNKQVNAVENRLNFSKSLKYHNSGIETVNWEGETLAIFNRQYADTALSLSGLDAIEKTILHCIFTRHYDGYIRQAHLQALATSDYPDIATPFVMRLFSDYVLEVLLEIEPYILNNMDSVLRFITTNPTYWHTQKSRVVTLWNEHYRHANNRKLVGHRFYERLKDYPISPLLSTIQKALNNLHNHQKSIRIRE